jgi:prolipoprotein diacylglyceryltransferase
MYVSRFWIPDQVRDDKYTSPGGKAGIITGSYLIGYGLIRILLENFRAEEIIWRAGGLPVAIWFGIISLLIGLILIIKKLRFS